MSVLGSVMSTVGSVCYLSAVAYKIWSHKQKTHTKDDVKHRCFHTGQDCFIPCMGMIAPPSPDNLSVEHDFGVNHALDPGPGPRCEKKQFL